MSLGHFPNISDITRGLYVERDLVVELTVFSEPSLQWKGRGGVDVFACQPLQSGLQWKYRGVNGFYRLFVLNYWLTLGGWGFPRAPIGFQWK